MRFEPSGQPPDELQVGFDMVDSAGGAFALHGPDATRSPLGLEVVVRILHDSVLVLADAAVQQWEVRPVRRDFVSTGLRIPSFDKPPAGLFTGRWAQEFSRPLRPVVRERGDFRPSRVVTNRLRFGRDGTEYAAAGYDRGILREGPMPDGDWERAPDGAIEIRVPWLLLNVSDPSGRHVLLDPPMARGTEAFGVTQVPDVGITLGARRGSRWSTTPADGVARYAWESWDEPRWEARRRPGFEVMRDTWRALELRISAATTAPASGRRGGHESVPSAPTTTSRQSR